MADEKLKAYFKFDENDLQANRSGRLSENQKAQLAELGQSKFKMRKIYGFLGLVLGLGIASALPFLFRDLWFLWIPFGLFSVLAGFYLLRNSSGKSRSYKVRKMQGAIKYSRHTRYDRELPTIGHWIMHVGKSWFNVAEDMPGMLKEGAEYAVYTYSSDGSTHILSAELVAEKDSLAETATLRAQ